ncbi:hypothetical protein NMY22_g15891 [Coprinellus aureogranulatus]|nr:hypothetical protein NMY22_g15891 [Coprinellus aureogranulatus]
MPTVDKAKRLGVSFLLPTTMIYQKNREDDEREEEFKHRLLEIMRSTVRVVDDAQKANAGNLSEVAEKAEDLLYKCVVLAYDVVGGEIALFESLESFAHTDQRPLVKHGDANEDQFSNKVHKLLPLFMQLMQGRGEAPWEEARAHDEVDRISDPGKASEIANIFRPTIPWKDVVRLHPLSTRCARFMKQVPDSCPPGDKPKALSVFQARAEATYCASYFPSQMLSSASGKCILTLGRGGWKERSPMIVAVYPNQSTSADMLPDHHLCPGLADVAYHGAVDDDSGLLFAGDGNRIKSYSWYDTSANAYREELYPTHTMDSKGFDSAIGILPNGRLARAGRGKVAVWNISELPTHDNSKKGIIGKSIAKREEDINTWRDDPEEIERSSGSLPSTTITLTDSRLEIANWHPHPNAPGEMLVTAESRIVDPPYYCRVFGSRA